MSGIWTTDSITVTADSTIYTADGGGASGQLVMPNLVGLLIWEAINVLTLNGNINFIGAPSSFALGYFTPYPVSVNWLISSTPINTVFAQSISAGTVVVPNAPITLSISRTPLGASWP